METRSYKRNEQITVKSVLTSDAQEKSIEVKITPMVETKIIDELNDKQDSNQCQTLHSDPIITNYKKILK